MHIVSGVGRDVGGKVESGDGGNDGEESGIKVDYKYGISVGF